MFERPKSGERALLVHVNFHTLDNPDLDELVTLAKSAGAEVVETVTTTRKAPDAKFYIGKGKVTELGLAVNSNDVELIIFNHPLTPAQERNLEKELKCRVLDRTGLILDIFAQRARTYEGKLQVELAQLQHLSTRLIRGWTHLERQKGGIGLRGPGETQLETDRRLIRGRIQYIQRRLAKVRGQRMQSGLARRRSNLPTIALVGYTNAGKSTLFNKLTNSDVYAADKLFATLDPTLRKVTLSGLGDVIFVDTVGFIRELPHDLVDAFNATLEETRQADCLLHVIDLSDPDREEKKLEVLKVLKQIGADNLPLIEVFNKIDLKPGAKPGFQASTDDSPARVWLSANTQNEFPELVEAITAQDFQLILKLRLKIPPAYTGFKIKLFQAGAITEETVTETGEFIVDVSINQDTFRKLSANFPWENWIVE